MHIQSKLFWFLVLVFIGAPINVFAAESDNAVLLYQMINEFRLKPSSCVMQGVLSLTALKRNSLLEKAASLNASGLPLSEALNQAGYGQSYAKVLVVGGVNIKQVFRQIMEFHCLDIADRRITEVGAMSKKYLWWIVLAYQINDDDNLVLGIPKSSFSQRQAGSFRCAGGAGNNIPEGMARWP